MSFSLMHDTISRAAAPGIGLTTGQVAEVLSRVRPVDAYKGKRVLLIVPDGTRTAPVGLLFQTLHQLIGGITNAFDVLVALGTHQPLSEEAMCRRLEISESERRGAYRRVQMF